MKSNIKISNSHIKIIFYINDQTKEIRIFELYDKRQNSV